MLRLYLFLVCALLLVVLPAQLSAQQSKVVSPKTINSEGDPPSTPTLESPANGAVDQPIPLTLSWSEVSDAETYRLQISINSSFTAPLVLDDTSLTLPFRDVNSLNYSTTYWWRVRAASGFGSSNWPSRWSFTTRAMGRLGYNEPEDHPFGA